MASSSEPPRELFEADGPERLPAVRSWLVPVGSVPTIALPGVWRVELTASGGFLVSEVVEDPADE